MYADSFNDSKPCLNVAKEKQLSFLAKERKERIAKRQKDFEKKHK